MKATESESGEILKDASYTLSDFSKRVGLKRDALRSARRNGLKVIYQHNRAFIRGRDWLSYLDGLESTNETPETDNAPRS